jgi:hypothetical protein
MAIKDKEGRPFDGGSTYRRLRLTGAFAGTLRRCREVYVRGKARTKSVVANGIALFLETFYDAYLSA